MTAISTATPRYAQATSTTVYPVNAGAHIYEGALVCVQVSDGMLVDGTATTGTIFAGIADQTIDGGAADGDVTARVRQKGVFTLAASSGAATNVGKPVYLVDNNTVAVAPQTGAILVGYCVKYNSATSLDVDITGYAGTPAGSGGSGYRHYYGSGAFTTTNTSVAVSAGGLTTVKGGVVSPVIAANAAAAANGQLTFTGAAGAITVGSDQVTVTRIAGTDSGLAFHYHIWGN